MGVLVAAVALADATIALAPVAIVAVEGMKREICRKDVVLTAVMALAMAA